MYTNLFTQINDSLITDIPGAALLVVPAIIGVIGIGWGWHFLRKGGVMKRA